MLTIRPSSPRSGVALDLGTVGTLVSVPSRGTLIEEPTVVARRRGTDHVVAVGSDAEALAACGADDLDIVHPLGSGVVSDPDAATALVAEVVRRAAGSLLFARPTLVVGVPDGATDVERHALAEVVRSTSRHPRVSLVSEALAAALGAGPGGAEASVIVDIGGGTTELAVVAGGHRTAHRSIRVAGNAMDEAVARAVRSEHGLVIGARTAETLKVSSGLVGGGPSMTVTGRDARRWGWLRSEPVEPALVAEALGRPAAAILRAFEDLIADVPPDLAEAVVTRGVRLAGGGSQLLGLADRFCQTTCCAAKVVDDPVRCVLRGLERCLRPDRLRPSQPADTAA